MGEGGRFSAFFSLLFCVFLASEETILSRPISPLPPPSNPDKT